VSILNEGVPVPVTQLHPVSGLPVTFGTLPVVIVFIQLAVVTRTDLTYARDYVPRHHVLFPLVVDETGDIRAQFGLETDATFTRSLLRLRPSNVKAWLDGLSLSRDPAMPNGDLGGELAIDRNGRVIYARAFTSVLDQPDVQRLVDAVL